MPATPAIRFPVRSILFVVASATCLAMPPLAHACEQVAQERRDPGGKTSWIINVRERAVATNGAGSPVRLAGNCTIEALAEKLARSAASSPGAVISISGHVVRGGSPALALARVSLAVERLQQTLLQKIGRLRLPVEARLTTETEATDDPAEPGWIELHLHQRKSN